VHEGVPFYGAVLPYGLGRENERRTRLDKRLAKPTAMPVPPLPPHGHLHSEQVLEPTSVTAIVVNGLCHFIRPVAMVCSFAR